MRTLGVLVLFLSTGTYASTNPTTDIYSDSLTIQRSSAEIPGSLEASNSVKEFDPELDGQAIESASEIVEAAKPEPVKTGRKTKKK